MENEIIPASTQNAPADHRDGRADHYAVHPKIVEEQVFDRIDLLLKEQGQTQQKLIATLGLNKGTYTNWKRRRSKSYMDHIEGIAAFFRVSPSYLFYGIKDGVVVGTEAAREIELLRLYRKLGLKKQECVIQVIRALLSDGF